MDPGRNEAKAKMKPVTVWDALERAPPCPANRFWEFLRGEASGQNYLNLEPNSRLDYKLQLRHDLFEGLNVFRNLHDAEPLGHIARNPILRCTR